MEPIPEHINKTITFNQAVGVAVSIILALASGLIWVGTIEARVTATEQDIPDLQGDVDQIKKDTHYIRGRLDQMWGPK